MLINKQVDLVNLCQKLQDEKFVTVDTEFIRDNSYWAKLCLVQIAAGSNTEVVAAIDPLAKDIDLTPFYEIINNEKILKVMHGCRQDIEIFYHETKTMPKAVFDTQIAGMVCGFGDQVSYEKLVKTTLGKDIDKSSRYTDWAMRPLDDKQLNYALSDVTFLREVYMQMLEQLNKENRIDWIVQDHNMLLNPDTYNTDPSNAWQRLKIKTTKPQVIANLMAIAKWREEIAQKRNRPRARIMKDDIIQNLALHQPKTIKDFDKIRRFPKDLDKQSLEKLIMAFKNADPKKNDTVRDKKIKRVNLSAEAEAVIELLRVLLKYTCEEHQIAPKLLANASDIEAIAQDDNADVPALKGWRYDVFGKMAIDLKNGKYGVAVKNGKIKFFEL